MALTHRGHVVAALGTAQTLAWASTYYLPAMLAAPMARDLGTSPPTVFAAFSLALVASALVGPWSGRAIDHYGGRPVLMTTSLVFAGGLACLGSIHSVWSLFATWALLGVAMGSGLYEAAFATLVRLYSHDSRNTITGITLIAGFASTVGWPLSAWLESRYGWRGACFGWAALHLLLGLPLNGWLPRPLASAPIELAPIETVSPSAKPDIATNPEPMPQRPVLTTALLAFAFAATWFISTAMAAHLPRMLQATGASLAVAVGVGALIGPAQVAVVGATGCTGSPDGCHRVVDHRPGIGAALRGAARRGQWHPDDRQGHAPAGAVRRKGLWRAARLALDASARCAGAVTLPVRAGAGTLGRRGVVVVGRFGVCSLHRTDGSALDASGPHRGR
jgi:MFS family permease